MARVNAIANIGSMPAVVPAISEMVPVGATEVTCALRLGPDRANRLSVNAGNAPRSSASLRDAVCAACCMRRMSRVANRTASSLSYGIPSAASSSAKPMTPSPILRVARAASPSSGKG
ncbi:Uncharacterised protein [Mycobacterium tuberculosis]|nr:Uncharacterised protein [Mycobacterium tuberculosis]CNV31993.1 Uncharacterised protein [Mycobacterium tuberculosis]CNV51624.1 Uncharacterised protein [Mycobacterium tuberculosis]CNW90146.1 Uncharacterised protein [Mycobacterium tuberculosis]CNY40743.1 Uncharacterised protein [Mycobacterium tuberculosis]